MLTAVFLFGTSKNGKTWFTFGFMTIHILEGGVICTAQGKVPENYVDFSEIVQFIFTTGNNISELTFSMAMWGNHIQKVKIVINNNIIEQVTDFKYLG